MRKKPEPEPPIPDLESLLRVTRDELIQQQVKLALELKKIEVALEAILHMRADALKERP